MARNSLIVLLISIIIAGLSLAKVYRVKGRAAQQIETIRQESLVTLSRQERQWKKEVSRLEQANKNLEGQVQAEKRRLEEKKESTATQAALEREYQGKIKQLTQEIAHWKKQARDNRSKKREEDASERLSAGETNEEVSPEKTIKTTEYTIGIRDVLDVSVWQFDELTKELTVGPDGKITFPLIGEIYAKGLTPTQLAGEIRQKLTFYVKDPKVSVGVKEFGGKKVLILGEVIKPGVYYLENQARLAEIVSMAGGYTEDAVLKSTKIIRGDLKEENVISVDLAKLVKRGDMNQNIIIQEGDIVYLPRVFIASVNYLFRQILPTLYFTDLGVRTKVDIEKAFR